MKYCAFTRLLSCYLVNSNQIPFCFWTSSVPSSLQYRKHRLSFDSHKAAQCTKKTHRNGGHMLLLLISSDFSSMHNSQSHCHSKTKLAATKTSDIYLRVWKCEKLFGHNLFTNFRNQICAQYFRNEILHISPHAGERKCDFFCLLLLRSRFRTKLYRTRLLLKTNCCSEFYLQSNILQSTEILL